MDKFTIIFKCQSGEIKLENCSEFPTKEKLEKMMKGVEDSLIGKTKEIIIRPLSA